MIVEELTAVCLAVCVTGIRYSKRRPGCVSDTSADESAPD